jgi:hypothetical protein
MHKMAFFRDGTPHRFRRASPGAAPLALALLVTALAAMPSHAGAPEGPDPAECPPVAFLRRPYPGRNGTNATMLARQTAAGSAIVAIDPARPDREPRTLFADPEGYIFDMAPSFDATRLIFAYKKRVRERTDSFHLYEIRTDGSGLRQITRGPYHDVSPAYLPDGRIVFVSTRVASFAVCQNFLAAALYVCDADGSSVRRLEYNTLSDTSPYVMDDGTVLFSRWEYQDKNIFCVQGLWTLNPDGSRLALFYGNTLTVPNSIHGAKQIPGTRKVLCTMAAHHHRPIGAVAVIDRCAGLENPAGMVNLTPEVPYQPRVGPSWNEGKNRTWRPGDTFHDWTYADPWPVSEDRFLVAYGGGKKGPKRFRLFLMDDQGAKTLLHDAGKASCFNPVPLAPRPRPPVVAGALPPPEGEGTFFVQDVYQGLLEYGVKRGQVKRLRVMSQVPKKYNTEGRRYRDHYPAIGHGSYYVKYTYGTVPVAPDGSAYFTAPAGVELYFVALGASGKEIRRMGSVTQITAGEVQGCIGCHEPRSRAPPVRAAGMHRLRRAPDRITPPPWGAGTVDFARQVQPVLDRHCVRCHSGRAPKAGLDLSGDKTRLFNMAFEGLTGRGVVDYYWIHDAPTGNFPPLASGSWTSRLTAMIEDRHGDVRLDAESRRRIYHWIDANVPYYGTWDMTRPHTMGGRDTWFRLNDNGKPEAEPWFRALVGVFNTHCGACHNPGGASLRRPNDTSQCGIRNDWINLTRPEFSRVLNAHLAKDAGGLGIDNAQNGRTPPSFKDTGDPVYQALLAAIEEGKQALAARPRVDMPGAEPVAQKRDFGKTF